MANAKAPRSRPVTHVVLDGAAPRTPRQPKWKSSFVQANGIRFHVVTAGTKGPLVILLHGFPQFWYAWRRQIPALAKKFRVVVPDLRGYGETDKPRGVSAYTLPTLSKDVAELIRAMGETKAHVVGHDWGGAIAWDLATRYPQVVDRLVVLNAPHPKPFLRHLLTNPRQIARSWYMFFFQLPWLPERKLLADGARAMRSVFRTHDGKTFEADELREFRAAAQKPGAMTASLNYYRAAFRRPFAAGAIGAAQRKITSPTLLIWGEDDIALGKELTYGMEGLFAGPFRVEYIRQCSHWVMEERPEQVNKLLVSFLSTGGKVMKRT